MEAFSDTLDTEALKAIEAQMVQLNETQAPLVQPPVIIRRKQFRRSKTLNFSSSFTSDGGDIIEESPTSLERISSLRDKRDKIQKNVSIKGPSSDLSSPRSSSLKRIKSDGGIKRSKRYILESIDSTGARDMNADQTRNINVSKGSGIGNDTARQILDVSEFSILGRANVSVSGEPPPIATNHLKRQRSDDLVAAALALSRHDSVTPPMISRETSLLNLPILNSQDLNIMIDSNLLMESTKVTLEIDDEINGNNEQELKKPNITYDLDSITFTGQDTLELLLNEEERRRCKRDVGASYQNIPLNQNPTALNCKSDLYSDSLKCSQLMSQAPRSLILDETLNLKLMSSWNLPPSIEREYEKKGIVTMFDWQVKCLNNPKVLMENKNLVYSAPTSAGKTLVSEILMIKNVLERQKKAMLVLPFVSVVREKTAYLQDVLNSSGIRVDGFFGGYSPPGGFANTQVAVCTIEKANSIVNKLLEEQKLDILGIIVVDEVHLIGDPNRGYILELLLAKILYMTKKYSHIQIQVVAMSATLPKLELLCTWMEAEMYVTDYRPVALNEMIKINSNIYNNSMELIRTLKEEEAIASDLENVAQLCLETIAEQCSVIVFGPTKERCEKLALSIAETIRALLKGGQHPLSEALRHAIQRDKLEEVKSQMKLNCPTGLDEVLGRTVTYGCAFHHASLTTEERDIIETSFKSGALKLIVATSTLSSGVNLPARRVIIRTPLFGGKIMNALVYKQMIGRAGRTGRDTVGESILICNDQNRKLGEELVAAQLLSPITSCLVRRNSETANIDYNDNNIKRALLEIIAAGVATTNEDLMLFVQSTLFFMEHSDLFADLNFNVSLLKHTADKAGALIRPSSESNILVECVKFLIEYEFVRIQIHEEEADSDKQMHFLATRLGLACLSSSLPPADGFLLFSELQRSRQCFVLESELHAIYLVTPYSVCNQVNDIDWLLFLDLWERLPSSLQRVGEIVGIRDAFIVKAMRGQRLDYKLTQIHKRFFIALALQELVNEKSIAQVAVNFKVHRGLLQSLQQMAGTFAGIVHAFCKSLNWTMLSLIIGQFKERLFFGIHHDLMDLMRISSLNSQRARALHTNGIESLLDLAQSNVFDVEKILHHQVEFQSEKQQHDNEQKHELEERKQLRNFFVTGKVGITVKEGAELIIGEARHFLELEMGIRDINWSRRNNGVDVSVDIGKDLKRHSTEELLEESLGAKRDKKETSFATKFSTELFELEQSGGEVGVGAVNPEQDPKKTTTTLKRSATDDMDETTEDNNGESDSENIINRSNVMSEEKFENDEPSNFENIHIIRICDNLELFSGFQKLLLPEHTCHRVGLSLGVTHIKFDTGENLRNVIGANIIRGGRTGPTTVSNNSTRIDGNRILSGISICLDGNIAFYMNLVEPTVVPWSNKVDLIRGLFNRKNITLCMIDMKDQLKVLAQVFASLAIHPELKFEDCKVANWILLALTKENRENNLIEMTKLYCPECTDLVELLCYDLEKESFASGINGDNDIPASMRAAIESCAVLQILKYQRKLMERGSNGSKLALKLFQEIEMPLQVSLTAMELRGVFINEARLNELIEKIKTAILSLEQQIYHLHGHKFNLRSSKELKTILGVACKQRETLKECLEALDSPLSRLIRQYRKLGGVLAKMIYPISRTIANGRIHCSNITFTATGRINMQEPSLQTLAKDFEIKLPHDNSTQTRSKRPEVVSIRSLFQPKPKSNRYFVSADFCQLELRILTHFCCDKTLLKILKTPTDVFRAIAAQWNDVSADSVSESLRNDTKQICYGIIYGMGNRSLSAALKTDEETARRRIQEFHDTYPAIKLYVENTIKDAEVSGFVETLCGRRRYFRHLQPQTDVVENQMQAAMRAQQRRQAFNTKIQGSAADILKLSVLSVEQNLRRHGKSLQLHMPSQLATSVSADADVASRVDLVLHLHDELMYEVPTNRLKTFAKLLKSSMESAITLKVPLPVKLKAGPNWGELKEITL